MEKRLGISFQGEDCVKVTLCRHICLSFVLKVSSLIRHVEVRGDIHRVKNCKNALIISHLFFADDCFLFFLFQSG
jgi:hypothetical protein